MVWFLAIMAASGVALVLVARRSPNLSATSRQMLTEEVASDATRPHPIVTDASIATLPTAVQRYIRQSGAVGKPRPASLTVTYDAQLFSKTGAAMTGVAVQYDRFDPPKRLFFLPTKMFGLPVKVLHNYDGVAATLLVRLVGLVSVVDAGGVDFSRIETVTLLNDLCLFAPGWLSDPRLTWTSLDDRCAAVTFRNGPHVVSATLFFNDIAELVTFTSTDRGALQSVGRAKLIPWSTPVSRCETFGNQRLFTDGRAIWHNREGDVTYRKFIVTAFEAH